MNTPRLAYIFASVTLHAVVVCTPALHAAIPAAAQQEIEQLVQQNKFDDALAKVNALLKASPTDKELLDLKAQLEKSAKPVATGTVSKLELAELKQAVQELESKPTGSAERGKLIAEVQEKSASILQRQPDNAGLWLLRAKLAVEQDNAKQGWEAGKNLLRLGADNSDDQQAVDTVATLKRKGWLAADYAAVEKAQATAEAAKGADRLKFVSGKWGCEYNYEGRASSGSGTRTLSIKVEDATIVLAKPEKHFSGFTARGIKFTEDRAWEAPGSYSYRFTSSSMLESGGGDLQLKDCRLSQDGFTLEFRITGATTESSTFDGETERVKRQVNDAYRFLIDRDNARLITVSEDELREDPKELLQRLKNAQSSQKRPIYSRE
jgi:hypothetical protein